MTKSQNMAVDLVSSLTGLHGLLLEVSHLFAVLVLVLWVGLGKNIFGGHILSVTGDANNRIGADLIVHERLVLAIHVENVCV